MCGASVGLGLEVKKIEVKEAKVKTIEAKKLDLTALARKYWWVLGIVGLIILSRRK